MKNMIMVFLLAVALMSSGCASMGMNGAMGGGATGALIGQIIGHSTEATLIGAAAGTVLGYIGGNEWDKYQMRQPYIPQQQMVPQQYYQQAPQQYPTPHYQQQYYNPRRGY
jgi:phage tail tape-measure protein